MHTLPESYFRDVSLQDTEPLPLWGHNVCCAMQTAQQEAAGLQTHGPPVMGRREPWHKE